MHVTRIAIKTLAPCVLFIALAAGARADNENETERLTDLFRKHSTLIDSETKEVLWVAKFRDSSAENKERIISYFRAAENEIQDKKSLALAASRYMFYLGYLSTAKQKLNDYNKNNNFDMNSPIDVDNLSLHANNAAKLASSAANAFPGANKYVDEDGAKTLAMELSKIKSSVLENLEKAKQYNKLGLDNLNQNSPKEAIANFEEATKLNPSKVEYRKNLARSYNSAGLSKSEPPLQKMKFYEKALNADPENKIYKGNAALLEIECGYFESAKKLYFELLKEADNSKDIENILTNLARIVSNDEFKSLLKKYPSTEKFRFEYGKRVANNAKEVKDNWELFFYYRYEKKNPVDTAYADWKRLVAKSGEPSLFRNDAALLLLDFNPTKPPKSSADSPKRLWEFMANDGIKYCSEMLKKSPDDHDALNCMANAYYAMGKPRKSVEYYDSIIVHAKKENDIDTQINAVTNKIKMHSYMGDCGEADKDKAITNDLLTKTNDPLIPNMARLIMTLTNCPNWSIEATRQMSAFY